MIVFSHPLPSFSSASIVGLDQVDDSGGKWLDRGVTDRCSPFNSRGRNKVIWRLKCSWIRNCQGATGLKFATSWYWTPVTRSCWSAGLLIQLVSSLKIMKWQRTGWWLLDFSLIPFISRKTFFQAVLLDQKSPLAPRKMGKCRMMEIFTLFTEHPLTINLFQPFFVVRWQTKGRIKFRKVGEGYACMASCQVPVHGSDKEVPKAKYKCPQCLIH